MLNIKYTYDGKMQIEKHIYSGDVNLDSIINDKRYNRKELIFPGGYRQIITCNNPVFGIKSSDRKKLIESESDETEKTSKPRGMSGINIRDDNILRCENMVAFILLLNLDLKYFVTVTFDDKKVDGTNVNEVMKKCCKWLNNQRERKGLKYILVPEYHPEKNEHRIHLHGCVNEVFNFVDSGTRTVNGYKKPMKIGKIQRLGIESDIRSVVYNIPEWKYGFSTAIPVYGTRWAMARYVSKYVGKATKENGMIFGKMYWSSKNLNRYPENKLVDDLGLTFASVPAKEYNPGYGDIYKYQKIFGDITEDEEAEIEAAYQMVFTDDNPGFFENLTAKEKLNIMFDNIVYSKLKEAIEQHDRYIEIYNKAEEERKKAEAEKEARKNTELIKKAVEEAERKRQLHI